jgi:hypothetical protein
MVISRKTIAYCLIVDNTYSYGIIQKIIHNRMSAAEIPSPSDRYRRLALPIAALTLTAVTALSPDNSADAAVAAEAETHDYAITTYNILGSNHVAMGRITGGSLAARAHRAAAYIEGHAGAPTSDIVGMQELEPDQWRMFNKFLEGYRSEERRVGKECRRLCRSRWSPYH